MAKTISIVNATADTFQTWITRTNEVINAVSTEVVTANNDANGALTTGNAQLAGTMSVLVLAANTVRGGNVQTTRVMNVVSNVQVWELNVLTVGNGTVNVTANSTTFSSANTFASVRSGVGANVYMDNTRVFVGNSTINAAVNSTAVTFNRTTGVNTAIALLSTAADSLYGLLELGGNTGGYIDFKQPSGDDFDYRIMANSSGFHIVAGSSTSTANQFNVTLANISLGTNSLFIAHTTNTVTLSNTLCIGTGTTNVVANSTIIKLANSSVNTAIRVPTGAEYAATNIFLHANGSWVAATVGSAPYLTASDGIVDLTNFTTSGTSAQVITSWTKGSYRAGELLISVIDNAANAHSITKLVVLHNDSDTDAFYTEYAMLVSNTSAGQLGTFLANCNTTHVKINFTPTVAATTVRMTRQLLSV